MLLEILNGLDCAEEAAPRCSRRWLISGVMLVVLFSSSIKKASEWLPICGLKKKYENKIFLCYPCSFRVCEKERWTWSLHARRTRSMQRDLCKWMRRSCIWKEGAFAIFSWHHRSPALPVCEAFDLVRVGAYFGQPVALDVFQWRWIVPCFNTLPLSSDPACRMDPRRRFSLSKQAGC